MRLQGMTRSVIDKITTGGLQMLSEKHAKEMETEVSIQVINELFAHKTAQSMKGWRLVKDPIVQCLNITQKM
jgi:predicted nuclease of restriction endonuclease-like RecB superfamily